MKRGGIESQLDYIHNDNLFNEIEDEFDLRVSKNMNMPRKGNGNGLQFKRNGRLNSKSPTRAHATQNQIGAQVVSMFDLE